MHRLLPFAFAIVLIGCSVNEEKKSSQPMRLESLDPSFDSYFAEGDSIEILAEGFNWSEGPLWIEDGGDGYLIFSDVPENRIYKWKEGEGKSVYLEPSGFTGDGMQEGSNGLILDQQGRLLLCQHGDRRVARMGAELDNPQAAFETVADRYDLKRFNSPNDLCMDKAGNIYFTDPPYGLPAGVDDPGRELDFMGVYKVDTAGQVSLLIDSLSRPNGIALSPDESTLYVANSDPDKAIWMAYELNESKEVVGGQLLLDATEMLSDENKGLPDGLRAHPDGTLFATGPGGVLVISPEGKHLGTIRTGQATANCTFGNKGKYLYMTADMYLMRVAIR